MQGKRKRITRLLDIRREHSDVALALQRLTGNQAKIVLMAGYGHLGAEGIATAVKDYFIHESRATYRVTLDFSCSDQEYNLFQSPLDFIQSLGCAAFVTCLAAGLKSIELDLDKLPDDTPVSPTPKTSVVEMNTGKEPIYGNIKDNYSEPDAKSENDTGAFASVLGTFKLGD